MTASQGNRRRSGLPGSQDSARSLASPQSLPTAAATPTRTESDSFFRVLTTIQVSAFLALSPVVAAQTDAPVPEPSQLILIALFTLVLVFVVLSGLRRRHGSDRITQALRPKLANQPPTAKASGGQADRIAASEHADIMADIGSKLRQCHRQGTYFCLLRLGMDDALAENDRYSRAAINETLLSISRSRAACLFQFSQDDYLIVLCGEPPDQARRIAEDYRESIVDLSLSTSGRPLTASIGMCSGPADAGKTAQHFMDCAAAALERARQLGGNRVEARQE